MSPLVLILIGSIAFVAIAVAAIALLRTRIAVARRISQTSAGVWSELRQWLRNLLLLDLRRSMREGVAALRHAIGKRTFRYDRPWYVMIGPAGAGKTAMLRSLTSPNPIADSGMLNWGIFRDGVVLDLAGTYSIPADQPAWYTYRRRVWKAFRRLLLYHRERRPLDGIVVVLPLSDIAQFEEGQQQQARLLADRLTELCRRIGMVLPVYVVVTHADQLGGFGAFVDALPAEQRHSILGWNSPYAPETLFDDTWAEQAIGSVIAQLDALQFDLLGRSRSPATLFGLQHSFEQIIEPVGQWLDVLFNRDKRSPWLALRGIYFVGATPTPSVPTESSTGTTADLCFVGDLFRTKIFREPAVARPKRRHLVRRSYASVAAHVATAAIVVGMITATAVQWKELRRRADTLQQVLEQIRDDRKSFRYEREKLQNPYYYADKTRQYLAYFATLEHNRLFSYGLPPSWIGALHNRLRSVLAQSLREVVMTGMKEEFLRRAQLITDPNATYLPADTLNLRRFDLATTPEYVAFARYVQAVAEFEYHAGLYNALAVPHRDQRLAKVIDYLYQARIEDDVAQLIESDYRLMERVRVEPVLIDQLRQRFAEKALRMVEQCTEHATLGNAVTSSVAALTTAYATVRSNTTDDEIVAAFTRLAVSLDRLAAALKHPNTEWMSREVFVPDATTKKLLERVAVSRLLGGTIRAVFERRMDSLFTVMRLQLVNTTVGMRNESSDSTAVVYLHPETKRFQLTPPMEKTAAAFVEWRKQPFAVLDGSRQQLSSLQSQLGPSQHIIWNATSLKIVTPTIEAYVKFLNDQMNLFPTELQVPAERVLQRGLQRTIQDIVVRAASVQTISGRMGEDDFSMEAQSLQEAAPHLIAALRQLSTSSDGSGHQLATILARQVAGLLSIMSSWLAERSLYSVSITDTKLLQWKPNQSVLSLAFDVQTTEEAQEYLARQREPIEQWCKQYVLPLLNFYSSSGIAPQASLSTQNSSTIRQWMLIARTLEGYTTKAPNNSLAKLEEFIVSLGNITLQTPLELQKAVIQRGAHSQEDYFARKIREIATDIRRGIIANADRRFHEDYRSIYQATTAIQRYFPFGLSNQDADPATVRSYLTSISNELAFARLLTALGGSIPDNHSQILAQLARAQEFFRPVTFASDPTSGAYTITMTYRTNAASEQNAAAVYTKVSVQSPNGQETGKLLFTPGEQATLQWRPGDQLSVDIRWAKESGIVPVQWIEGKYQLTDPRTASFRWGGMWSLLRMIANHSTNDASSKLRLMFRVLASAPVTGATTQEPTMVLYFDVDISPSSSDGILQIPFIGTLPAPR
jgi:type VI protein secretion system component VasK